MKKINILFILLIFSCSNNNTKNAEMNDSITYSEGEKPSFYISGITSNFKYETLKYYNKLNQDLIKKGFKTPDKILFKKKLFEIYNVNIDTSKYNETYLGLLDDSDIAFFNERCILSYYEIFVEDEIPKKIDASRYVYYNKMLFYNDLQATNWIKINEPYRIVGLVKTYGCTSNKDWLQFAFSKIDFTNSDEVQDLLFTTKAVYNKRTKTGTKIEINYVFRKEMLEKLIEFKVEPSTLSEIANMVEHHPELYEGEPLELVAYLYDATYRLGGYGLLNYLYDSNISYKTRFKQHKYFGLKDLEEFSEKGYEPREEREKEEAVRLADSNTKLEAQINDPDGYTNIRKSPDSNSEILYKINKGETFLVTPKGGYWWIVYYNGKTGWIHKSRVKLVN